MKRILATLALILSLQAPSMAYTVNMMGTYVPERGQFELLEYLGYYPFTLTVQNSETFLMNQEDQLSYDWMEAWTSFEAGLGNETSVHVVAPMSFFRTHVQGHARSSSAFGPFDIRLGLARKILSEENQNMRCRLLTWFPTGNADAGLGTGVPAVGFEHTYDWRWSDFKMTTNLQYRYHSRRPALENETLSYGWRGQSLFYGFSTEWLFSEPVQAIVEAYGQWDMAGEDDRQVRSESGGNTVFLAPGLTWVISEAFALQGSVPFSVWRSGYAESFVWSGVLGIIYDF